MARRRLRHRRVQRADPAPLRTQISRRHRDPSPAQIEYAQKLLPQVTFQVADSMALPFGEEEFDIAASALVIHFIPDRAKAFAEMRRVLRPGGLVAGYTWKRTVTADFAPYVPMLRGV